MTNYKIFEEDEKPEKNTWTTTTQDIVGVKWQNSKRYTLETPNVSVSISSDINEKYKTIYYLTHNILLHKAVLAVHKFNLLFLNGFHCPRLTVFDKIWGIGKKNCINTKLHS